MFRIIVKTNEGMELTFLTDKYSKTDLHIEFIDIKGNFKMFLLSNLLEVSEFESRK